VVLFLHGALNYADDYAELYPTYVYRPEDYDIIFLQTPRTRPVWMSLADKTDLNHHWNNTQVEEDMTFVSEIVDQLAALYGGHERVWVAGMSQGAVVSAAVALKGTPKVLGGAFVVAGYPVRPLYTDEGGAKDPPSRWSSAELIQKQKTKIYFYTGESDSVLPISQSFCRFKRVVDKYKLDPANYRFWRKAGYGHYSKDAGGAISPNGNEFHALWHVVAGKPDDVAHVTSVAPATDCKA